MARYIDATQLQAKILDAKIANKLPESRKVLTTFDNMVRSMPTADVAPKSEVAREIFEEIEKFDRRPLPEAKPVYILKQSEFAELKKKYTAQKQDSDSRQTMSCDLKIGDNLYNEVRRNYIHTPCDLCAVSYDFWTFDLYGERRGKYK